MLKAANTSLHHLLLCKTTSYGVGVEDSATKWHAVATGFGLVLVDILVVKGPLKNAICGHFWEQSSGTGASERRRTRLCGQVATRLVGTIFLILMFPYALTVLQDPHMKQDTLYSQTRDSQTCMALAAGYFLYDLFICTYRYSENGAAFFLHGFICCLAYTYPILSGHLHYMGASFLMWEISTPFLYFRWYLIKAGRGHTMLMHIANLLFAISFFGCRIVYGPIMSWNFWKSSGLDLANPRGVHGIPSAVTYCYRTALFVLNGLNYYWFTAIIRAGFRKDRRTQTEFESKND